MALAIDASTPALAVSVAAANSITTASFTPPSGALVLVGFVGNNQTGGVDTSVTSMTNTGTAITWTRRARRNNNTGSTGGTGTDGGAEWWTGVGTGGAITVTANGETTNANRQKILQCIVLTGADTASLANVAGASATSGVPSVAVAGCSAGSYVFGASSDWNANAVGTFPAGQTAVAETVVAGQITAHFWRTTSVLGGAGSQTMNQTAPSGQTWNIVGMEIKAAGGAVVVSPVIRRNPARGLVMR